MSFQNRAAARCWRTLLCHCLLWLLAQNASARFIISEAAKAGCVIVQQAEASEAEKTAAHQLSETLAKITGAEIRIVSTETEAANEILVGPGPVAAKYFPEVDFSALGPEEALMRVKGQKLLLAGGRPRGTVYAVNRFLHEQCGVRWWTPWAADFPRRPTLVISNLNAREVPAFEYRAPFWYNAFEPEWKAHNGANDEHQTIPSTLGGSIKYKGFAHTFYKLVPPENILRSTRNGLAK